mgnify:CR=1 FL=1
MADNSTILEKLDGLVARFEEISTLITDPAVIADQKRYVKLTKEYKELDDLMKARKEYIQLLGNIEEAKNILANESDAEMREMAKEEMDNSQERLPVLEEEIKLMLVPADPQDSKNAILEIRGGAGGDEAAIFAGDLFRMYAKFCETKGWKMEVSNANEGTAGGFKEIVCSVTGDNVYGILKYESGVHRVQRVPATETQGRVHTSAASVAVLPEAEEFDVVINEGEIKWDTFRSGGAGGQNVNKVESPFEIQKFVREVRSGDYSSFFRRLQSFFADTTYEVIRDQELHYENVLFIVFKLVGFYAKVEYHTSEGRIDLVLQTDKFIYIMEFKLNGTAEEALQQINDKHYALPFEMDERKLFKIGVNFSAETRNIEKWIVEEK